MSTPYVNGMSSKERFLELASRGLHSRQIATEMGISRQRVHQLAQSTGTILPPAPRGPIGGAPASPLRWGGDIKVSPSWVGAAGELTAAVNLIIRGYYVYHAVARTGPFDLIAYRDGDFHRVEVRSVRKPSDNPRVNWEGVDLLAKVLPDGAVIYSPFEP